MAVTFGTARKGLGRPLLAVPNVTAHPSTASVSIIVFLCNGPLLCGFNVSIKGLKFLKTEPPETPTCDYEKTDFCEYFFDSLTFYDVNIHRHFTEFTLLLCGLPLGDHITRYTPSVCLSVRPSLRPLPAMAPLTRKTVQHSV